MAIGEKGSSTTLLRFLRVGLTAAISAIPLSAVADSWPDFRGPRGDGHSDATGLPLSWSEVENVKWKTAIPGRGWSTPVVLAEQVWMTTATPDGHRLSVICVDAATGRVARNLLVFEVDQPQSIDPTNSYASPSPLIEPDRVFVHFGTYGTACLNTKTGAVLWKRRDLEVDHQKGPGSSPILHGDLLILQCDGNDVQYVIALNKRTGETVWKTERSFDLSSHPPDYRKSFCTPLAIQVAGSTEIVTLAAHAAFAYDPSTGRELWKLRYPGHTNVSRPVTGGDRLYFSTGYATPRLWAVRLGGRGELDDTHVVWKYRRSVSIKPSILHVDGLLYMVSDKTGIGTCLDAKTGVAVWTERLGGNYSASPVVVDRRIYFFSEDGKTTVIAPQRQFRVLAVNHLDGGFLASPAISGKAFFLRTVSHLYRIEE